MKTNSFLLIIIITSLFVGCTQSEPQEGSSQAAAFATPTTHPFFDPDSEFAEYAYYEAIDPIERFDLSSGEVYEAELELIQVPSLLYGNDGTNPEPANAEPAGSISELIITPVQPLGSSSPLNENSDTQDGTVEGEAEPLQISISNQVVDSSPLSSTGFGSGSSGAAVSATEPPSTESEDFTETDDLAETEDSTETAVSDPPPTETPTPTALPTAMPTASPMPLPAVTASQALTTTIPPRLAEIALRHTVFNERLNLNWSLENSVDTAYAVDSSHTAYQDGLTLAVSPETDFGKLQFTLREDTGVEIQRNRVVGVRFWVYGHDDVIEPGSLRVQIQGSQKNSYWTAEDNITNNTSHFIDIDTAVPPRAWVKVEFYINSQLLDNEMAYLTGFSIHNNEGFLQTYFIDGVQLLLLRQSDVTAPDTQASEENQDAG